MIRALANDSGDWDDILDELLGDDLLHQRSCYSATAPAIPFLTRLAVSRALPVRHRVMLHCWLLIAATRETASLIDDADRAAALGDTPKPAAYTTEVHAAVGAQLPVLLREWTRQPPAVQFVLSALAAVNRTHARVIAEPLNALLTTYSETQPGAYLRLAATLIAEDGVEALTLAEEIVAWDEHVSSFGLDAPGISPQMRTVMVLVDGSLNIAGNIA